MSTTTKAVKAPTETAENRPALEILKRAENISEEFSTKDLGDLFIIAGEAEQDQAATFATDTVRFWQARGLVILELCKRAKVTASQAKGHEQVKRAIGESRTPSAATIGRMLRSVKVHPDGIGVAVTEDLLREAHDLMGTPNGPVDGQAMSIIRWCEHRSGVETGSNAGQAANTLSEAESAKVQREAQREASEVAAAARHDEIAATIARASRQRPNVKRPIVLGLVTGRALAECESIEALSATIEACEVRMTEIKQAEAQAQAEARAQAQAQAEAEAQAEQGEADAIIAEAKAKAEAIIAEARAQAQAQAQA